jgi:S-disulfanyl-L-cysteine oxidoreductase SoxD
MTGRLVVAGMTTAVVLLAGARDAAAQGAPPRSTRAGVYTAAQADRGADVYAGMCRSCHSPASHTGVTFAKWWKGRTLAELFVYVSERMPKNDPGSLAPEQYADVVAYLLKLNAMPPGPAELAPDSAALAAVRIDVNDSTSGPPGAPVRKDPRRRR